MSVGTGQRIVTTPLKPDYRAAHCPGTGTPQACRLFAETFHFHDLLLSPASTQGWHSNLQRVLTGDAPPGYQTPAKAYGADFVLRVPGVTRDEV